MRLQGKVALVTGAASGIGNAVAELLLKQGATVFAGNIKHPKPAYSPGIEAIKLDVASEFGWALGEVPLNQAKRTLRMRNRSG